MKLKWDRKYFLFVFLVTLIVFLGTIHFFVRDNRNLGTIAKLTKDAGYFISDLTLKPVRYFQKAKQQYEEKKDLLEKYEALKEELEKTNFMTSKYNEARKIIEELENMLDLNATLLESSYLNATVISRNLGYWYQKITIDKGSKNGVEEGMAVVTSKGLIGKVVSTSNFTSDIKLLTTEDTNQKISVKIQAGDSYVYGLLVGYDQKKKVFLIEGISGNTKINLASEVTTSGLGDIFPSGILVGYVSDITTDNFDLARTVEVTSPVDFDGISYVTVLKRKNS